MLNKFSQHLRRNFSNFVVIFFHFQNFALKKIFHYFLTVCHFLSTSLNFFLIFLKIIAEFPFECFKLFLEFSQLFSELS